jgi:type IV pilus assembly protein PilP
MTRRFTWLICGLFVCTCLAGCFEEESVNSTPGAKTKKVATKKLSKKVAPPKAKQEEKKEVEFSYVAEGRRDPFVPLSRIRKPIYDVDNEPATPLQRYDVAQFRLAGVIVGKGEAKAMVVAPDGKSYILAKGVKIGKNNGVVVDINSEAILVEEKYYDYSGNVIENIQVITVPKREGA